MMAQHRFPNYLELRPNLVWCWYIWWFPKVTRLLSYTGCFHSSTFTFSSNIENLALYLCLICLPYLNTIWNSCKLNAMIIRAWNGWTPVALTIEYCGGLNALVSQHTSMECKGRPLVQKISSICFLSCPFVIHLYSLCCNSFINFTSFLRLNSFNIFCLQYLLVILSVCHPSV